MSDLPLPIVVQEKMRIALPSSAILTDWAVLEESMREAVKDAASARDAIKVDSEASRDLIIHYKREIERLRFELGDVDREMRSKKYDLTRMKEKLTQLEDTMKRVWQQEEERVKKEKLEKEAFEKNRSVIPFLFRLFKK